MDSTYEKLFTQDILEIARERAKTHAVVQEIDQSITELKNEYQKQLVALEAEKAALLEPVTKKENDLIELVKLYLSRAESQSEEDELRQNISHLVNIRAKTEIVYDDKKALALALALNQQQYIRTKQELNKIELNKDLRAKAIHWEGLEYEVVDGLSISISDKLGELMILFPQSEE